jgi:diaminohydroxyphosphoribosylaminopyrimidine deaminase/5-amino-6-(5-phosphoribosylamino)uracil reductase
VTLPSAWDDAMREALALAQSPEAPYGENPRVGCVIVDDHGTVVGRGFHRGAGTPHAEVDALAEAGDRARGATAVVTLEPCRHTGRTGPCTQALLEAGVGRVVFAQPDPTAQAGGGADVLRAAGIEVETGLREAEARAVNEEWTFAVTHGRPFVTWKCAVSLDGRVAGPDGGPTALTGPAARREVHRLRSRVGAIIVGTGTALVDDPALTVREGVESAGSPPLRVVVGSRPVPPGARVLDDSAPTLVTAERDPRALLAVLFGRGVRHALLEGGPTLAAAFRAVGVIDRIDWYVAPVLLGAGPVALPSAGALTEVDVQSVTVVGEDVRVVGRLQSQEA